MEMVKWFKDCQICNVGLCDQLDEYIKNNGMSARAASKQMEKECNNLYSASQIRNRYRYYKKGHAGGGNPPRKGRNNIGSEVETGGTEVKTPAGIIGQARTGRKQVMFAMQSMANLVKDKKLNDGKPLDQMENELRLLVDEVENFRSRFTVQMDST